MNLFPTAQELPESGSSSLVESPSTSLVRGEARERKEKVNKIKFPRLSINITSGYELCPPPVRYDGEAQMLFSLKKRGEWDEARRDERSWPIDKVL